LRFDTEVTFIIEEGEPEYNPDLGRFEDAESESVTKWCHVHDLGTDELIQIYGRVDVKGLAIQHMGKPLGARTVKVGKNTYRILKARKRRNKASYLVGEVNA